MHFGRRSGDGVRMCGAIYSIPGIYLCTDMLSLRHRECGKPAQRQLRTSVTSCTWPASKSCGADCCKRMRYINHGLSLQSFLSALATGKEPLSLALAT